MDFWCQNGGKLAPKWDQKLMFTWEGDFSKIVLWLQRGLDFSGSWGPSIKNRSKNVVQDGMLLGIDLGAILVDFGSIVGRENRPKIDPKRHRKRDEKKKVTKIAKNSQQDALASRDPTCPGSLVRSLRGLC